MALDPRIVAAREAVLQAERERERIAAEVQAACPHPEVEHTWGHDGLVVYFKPVRRCLSCDLREGGQGRPFVSWYEGAGTLLADKPGRVVIAKAHDLDKSH
jgi:hypothetical protein